MILVTGASGLVGRHLVEALLKDERQVRCLFHSEGSARKLPEHILERCQPAYGDVRHPGSLGDACRGVAAVVHLVAVIREKGDATFRSVNVEGTRNVVEAAKAAGVKRFIHMSALGVRDDPRQRYGQSKWQGEEVVRRSGLDWTIFRPSVIYGEGFGFIDRVLQSVAMSPPPLVPVPGGGRTRFQPIHAGDVARCVVEGLDREEALLKTFELGGPEQLSYAEILDLLLQIKGMKRLKVPVPIPLMKLVVPLMERVLPDPPVTSAELAQLDDDNITDIDSVEKNFGFKPRTLREGLDNLLRN